MAKTVTFITTKYRNRPAKVSFYTRKGDMVKFAATKKMLVKSRVRFRTKNH